MGPTGNSETSVLNQLMPRNNPEDGRTLTSVALVFYKSKVRTSSHIFAIQTKRYQNI